MTDPLPNRSAFDADAPPSLPDAEGRVVAVVATGSTADWASTGAVELARAWGGRGRRVVLFDGGIDRPSLHGLLARDNDEGLTDAVVYGASVGRVARRVDGQPLFFVPAGTVVADPDRVMEHPRWAGMCRGFLQAGATLVVFIPSAGPGSERALRDATDIVVLAGDGDDVDAVVGDYADKVRAVLDGEGFAAPDAPEGGGALEAAGGLAATADSDFAGADDWFSVDEGLAGADDAQDALDDVPEPFGPDAVTVDDDTAASGDDDAPESGEDDAFALDESATEDEFFALDEVPAEDDPFALAFEESPADDSLYAHDAGDDDLGQDVVFAQDPTATDETPGEVEVEGVDPFAASSRGEAEDGASAAEDRVPVAEDRVPTAEDRVPTAEEIIAEAEAGEAEQAAASAPAKATTRSNESNPVTLVVLLLLLLGVVAGAWWFGYLEIPGLERPTVGALPGGTAQAASLGAEPQRSPVPSPATYSVALESHRDVDTAWRRMGELAARLPERLWIVAPVEIDGTVYHRVLAGPAADEAAAESLAATLAEALDADPSEWVVRATGRAFFLGMEDDRTTALDRAAALRDDGVPAYVLSVAAPGGTVRYRVYAGAYADAEEAAHLAAVLQERGLTATLSERSGDVP